MTLTTHDEITFNEYIMKQLPLLKPKKVTTYEDGEQEFTYNRQELYDFTRSLMHYTDVPYDLGELKITKKLRDFTPEEIKFYYPCAMVLAILGGNAFSNIEHPDNDVIYSYIPTIYAVMERFHLIKDIERLKTTLDESIIGYTNYDGENDV